MSTLLLRLAGPMQAWGTDSRFDTRFTGRDPSKSGVIGMVCAALGKPRDERDQPRDSALPSLARLAGLRMGVRVDRPGRLERDYQTAGGAHRRGETYGVAAAGGGSAGTVVSPRYYLADASFLVGLESDDDGLLRQLQAALRRPAWQLCLGRKACVPGVPVWLPDAPPLGPGIRTDPLREALRRYPWWPDPLGPGPTDGRRAGLPDALRLVLDEPEAARATEVRQDVPLSFAARRFTARHVRTEFVSRPDGGA